MSVVANDLLGPGAVQAVRCTAKLLLLILLLFRIEMGEANAADEFSFEGVERWVAIGDIHGDYDQYRRVMLDAGLINERGKWIGGKTHLIQTGDILDRGPDSRRIIDELRKLKRSGRRARGQIHMLFGNHEMMNIVGDLRYVHAGEYEAFRGRQSQARLDRQYELVVENRIADLLEGEVWAPDEAFRAAWYVVRPLGFIEHRLAWQMDGEYGQWAMQNPTIIRVNDTLFMHAGISALYADWRLEDINAAVTEGTRNFRTTEGPSILFDDAGPLWYRGLALGGAASEGVHLAALLQQQDAGRIVIGHTPTGSYVESGINVNSEGYIKPRLDSRVVIIDVGLAAYYGGNNGFLLYEGGVLYGVHRNHKTRLPDNDQGLLEYLDDVASQLADRRAINIQIEAIRNPPELSSSGHPCNER